MKSAINTTDKWSRAFVLSAGMLLLAAALVRFMVATGDSQILTMPDPFLGIPVRSVVVGVGGAELVIGLICLFGNSVGTQTVLLTWLMTNWAAYQSGLIYEGISGRCTCLGLLTDPLRLSHSMAERVTGLLPVYLLVGAYVVTVMVWIGHRRHRRNYLKVACPGCNGHIEFPAEVIGCKITCPHCGGGVHLQNLPRIA